MFYSASNNSFYDAPENYPSFPEDAIEISGEMFDAVVRFRPGDKKVVPGAGGLPELADISVPSKREQIEAERLRAYADPINGSDRYFSEAARLQMMGASEEEIQAARKIGMDRYAEIQASLPW
jgi:hypothetical protein